jgi:hypothetical protein
MPDLNRALTDVAAIRAQLAAGTVFQGFGPSVIALSGVLAAATWMAQSSFFGSASVQSIDVFLGTWIIVAVVASVLIGLEAIARARRVHGGLADALLFGALERFVPAGLAGAALAAVFYWYAPSALWLLPGLWQVLVGVGIASAARSLPGQINLVAGFYVLAGIAVLIIAAPDKQLAPWMMGLPFTIGQLLMAGLLYVAREAPDA